MGYQNRRRVLTLASLFCNKHRNMFQSFDSFHYDRYQSYR